MTEDAQQTGSDKVAVRPFHVNVPETELAELHRRINATRWPERETVTDASQGVQLETIQALALCAVGLISGSMIFSCSITEPGHPCVTMSGNAFSCFERT